MAHEAVNARDPKGDWRPDGLIKLPPIYARPMRPLAIMKWLFGFPGYLWPLNAIVLLITLGTWYLLTPDLAQMQSFELWWIAWVLVRNLGLTLVFFGGLHLYLYNFRRQADKTEFSDKPFQTNNKRFKFGDQMRDNMFRTLGYGVPIFTTYSGPEQGPHLRPHRLHGLSECPWPASTRHPVRRPNVFPEGKTRRFTEG